MALQARNHAFQMRAAWCAEGGPSAARRTAVVWPEQVLAQALNAVRAARRARRGVGALPDAPPLLRRPRRPQALPRRHIPQESQIRRVAQCHRLALQCMPFNKLPETVHAWLPSAVRMLSMHAGRPMQGA